MAGGNLYVGGMFTSYRGDLKGSSLIKVDLTYGDLEIGAFNTSTTMNASNAVNHITPSYDGLSLNVGGSFTGYRGTAGSLMNVNLTTGAPQ